MNNEEMDLKKRKYACTRCLADGCKLWRAAEDFADFTSLRCFICTCKEQNKNPEEINLQEEISIGRMVPAIPMPVQGSSPHTFWGGFAPNNQMKWWKNLPLFSTLHTYYKQKNEDFLEVFFFSTVIACRASVTTWALTQGGWKCTLSEYDKYWRWQRYESKGECSVVQTLLCETQILKTNEVALHDVNDDLMDQFINTPGCPKQYRSDWLNLREMDRTTHPDDRAPGACAPDVSSLPFRE